MKIDFFKKENNFKKKNSALGPNFYWEIIVFITIIILVSSFFFAYSFFQQINKEYPLLTIYDSGQVPNVDKVRIENVLNYFSDREQKTKEILSSPAPVVDPSL
jgi:hypothetical protein